MMVLDFNCKISQCVAVEFCVVPVSGCLLEMGGQHRIAINAYSSAYMYVLHHHCSSHDQQLQEKLRPSWDIRKTTKYNQWHSFWNDYQEGEKSSYRLHVLMLHVRAYMVAELALVVSSIKPISANTVTFRNYKRSLHTATTVSGRGNNSSKNGEW